STACPVHDSIRRPGSVHVPKSPCPTSVDVPTRIVLQVRPSGEREEGPMRTHRIVAALMALIVMSGPGFGLRAEAQPIAAVPPPPQQGSAPAPDESGGATPPRMSYMNGEVSFWRQGASDWTPAQLNTPLTLGDVLYTGPGGAVEIQIGRAAFVRAG